MDQENGLARVIEKAAQGERRSGWGNYISAYGVAILALIGSIAASLLAALEAEKVLTAVVAAIPAAVLAITRVFNFEHRAFFHWRKFWRLRKLLNQLRYENADPREVSRAFDNLDMEMLQDWIPFGTSGEDRSDPRSTSSAPQDKR